MVQCEPLAPPAKLQASSWDNSLMPPRVVTNPTCEPHRDSKACDLTTDEPARSKERLGRACGQQSPKIWAKNLEGCLKERPLRGRVTKPWPSKVTQFQSEQKKDIQQGCFAHLKEWPSSHDKVLCGHQGSDAIGLCQRAEEINDSTRWLLSVCCRWAAVFEAAGRTARYSAPHPLKARPSFHWAVTSFRCYQLRYFEWGVYSTLVGTSFTSTESLLFLVLCFFVCLFVSLLGCLVFFCFLCGCVVSLFPPWCAHDSLCL